MDDNLERGRRIRRAMEIKRFHKVHALAAELNVSAAAVSRWQNGGHISLENMCHFADRLDVSLDWLLLDRGTVDWHLGFELTKAEMQHIALLRNQPPKVRTIMLELLRALPEHSKISTA